MIVCPFAPSRGSAFPAAQHPFIPTILLQAVRRGVVLAVSAILFACSSARNAEFDQLIADGDFVQAKQLMQRLLDEYSVRDDNPTLPLRRAQAYYWLAYAHGRLAEYDSMNIALLECLSHDEGFSDERLDLMREFASREEALGVMAFNEGEYNSARRHFKTAAGFLSADNAHRQVSRHILRNLAFTEAASGNPAGAGSYLTEAFGLGDERSGSLLGQLHSEGSNYAGREQETTLYRSFVTFNNLPPRVTIRIFNLAGHLVRILEKNDRSQFLEWDLRNRDNWQVASGLYLCYVEMPDIGETKVLKLAVIQPRVSPY